MHVNWSQKNKIKHFYLLQSKNIFTAINDQKHKIR